MCGTSQSARPRGDAFAPATASLAKLVSFLILKEAKGVNDEKNVHARNVAQN
jgi:hypothetical protein